MLSKFGIALGAGMAAALLFSVTAKGTAISIALAYLAPLPIMIAAIGWGIDAGAFSSLVAAGVVALVIDPVSGLIFWLTVALPGAALAAETELRGSHLLFARAEAARPVLPESLRALGAEVDDVIAYRTVQDGSAAQRVSRALQAGNIDLVTFTSSSTVRNFVELVGTEIGGATVASIDW